MREKVLGSSNLVTGKNVKFSDKSQKKLIEDMAQMRKERNAQFYKRQAIKESEGRATEFHWIHAEVKRACFKLIIGLGRKVKNIFSKFRMISPLSNFSLKDSTLHSVLPVKLYDHFFTGGSLRDHSTRELLLLLVDFGNSLDEPLEEAKILLKNLYQCCGFFAAKDCNLDKSPEELVGLFEVEWTKRLEEIFHNASKARNTQDMLPLLKEVMAKFNAKHDFKVNKCL